MDFITQFKKRDNSFAKFEIKKLCLGLDVVDFRGMQLYIGGKEYDGEISSFKKNHVPENEIFFAVVNGYLREDTEEFEYIKGWNVFDALKELQKFKNSTLIEFPQVTNWGEVAIYKLRFATTEERFYECSNGCMLLNANGAILTDIEAFYENALIEALERR